MGKPFFTEVLFQASIIAFFLLTIIGLCVFNPQLRNYIGKFVDVNKSKRVYVLVSILPFYFCFVFATLYPKVLNVIWIFCMTICSFNSFILPSLGYFKLTKENPQQKLSSYCALLYGLFFIILSVTGISVKIFQIYKND